MRKLLSNYVSHTTGPRTDALERGAAVDSRIADDQPANVWSTLILGVSESTF
jgi:hypothetical protein